MDVPAIRITYRNGRWVTIDNRRLAAADLADSPYIKAKIATDDEVMEAEAQGKFENINGTSINVRGVGIVNKLSGVSEADG